MNAEHAKTAADTLAYEPDPKSRSAWEIATHIATPSRATAAYLRALGSRVQNIYGPSADAEP